VSDSGKAVYTETLASGNLIWYDLDSQIQCELIYSEEIGFTVGEDCELDWKDASLFTAEGEEEPSGFYGPGGEVFLFEVVPEGDEILVSDQGTAVLV
jgi:hypothetical protein